MRTITRPNKVPDAPSLGDLGYSLSFSYCSRSLADVRFTLPAQPVDATQALNLSAGVSNPKVLRGRSLS